MWTKSATSIRCKCWMQMQNTSTTDVKKKLKIRLEWFYLFILIWNPCLTRVTAFLIRHIQFDWISEWIQFSISHFDHEAVAMFSVDCTNINTMCHVCVCVSALVWAWCSTTPSKWMRFSCEHSEENGGRERNAIIESDNDEIIMMKTTETYPFKHTHICCEEQFYY